MTVRASILSICLCSEKAMQTTLFSTKGIIPCHLQKRRAKDIKGSSGYWEVLEWAGCIVRHHVEPRTTMFGHTEGDWSNSPIDPNRLRSERRSWMRVEGSEGRPVSLLDNWKEEFQLSYAGVERPNLTHPLWTGRTTFFFMADLAPNEIEPMADFSPSPIGRQGGEQEEEEEGTADEAASDPPTSQILEAEDRRSRSRSPRQEESRRVGYLEASQRLEWLDEELYSFEREADEVDGGYVGGQTFDYNNVELYGKEVMDAAMDYVRFCRRHPKYEPEIVRKAALLGDQMLKLAGSLEKAMGALRLARRRIIGVPTAGAVEEKVINCLDVTHAEYLKEMNEKGIPSRRYYPATRVKAEPYPSAMDYLAEMFEKAWKDGHWGIVLFATDETEDYTPNLIECPQGRVPKQLPDRSISAERRPIHAMLVANAATHKWQHPPAVQPRHRQIARKALWWSARNPGIRCTLAKLDVSRAFKWHDVHPGSCADFGSALPGEPVGVEGRVKMIYGGLPFGWCGAPGEYMIFALAGRAYHENFFPADPEVNGPTSFSSEWLMDDSVVVEPLLGVRPWMAVEALGHSIEQIWGKEALNLGK